MYKHVGYYWNNDELEIIKVDNEFYVLDCYNGDEFLKCWKVLDEHGLDDADDEYYTVIRPIFKILENGDSEIIDYEVIGCGDKIR